MTSNQNKSLENLNDLQGRLASGWIDYWRDYSLGTWQFWVHLAFLIIPLLLVYFLIDRRKALLLGFFGYNVHVWFTYIDAYGIRKALWNYPFQIIPILPVSFGLDAALIPVSFMLLYQWTLNHKKNYYVYIITFSIFLAFIFKPILSAIDMFKLYKGTTYFHLFLGYLIVALLSKWITNIFLHFQLEQRERPEEGFNLLKRIRLRKQKAR